ncbi:MAG: M1 family metallopeptidase [Deltaproteobacteria bacterium]
MLNYISFIVLVLLSGSINAQANCYWQQKADYKIHLDVNVKENSFEGKETITYFNNSPDTLHKIYFHLYYNAFKRGSMMDIRSSGIIDPEREIDKKFLELKENEEGSVSILSFSSNGTPQKFEIFETILSSKLTTPVFPGDSIVFEIEFLTRIPVLLRRAGRDSKEGIDYSMAQWYPKVVAYDDEGYHPDIYIGREFYGVFGDFDVTIDIDDRYKVAAGARMIQKSVLENNKIRYHFQAENVHDFVWAADRDYITYSIMADSNVTFNFFYQNTVNRNDTWLKLGEIMKEAFRFMKERYGDYLYPFYNFIEGGDGGMEYPLATLITGDRNLNSLVGISVHELLHSWYHSMIATNESRYHWMDEGFASFATVEVLKHLSEKKLINREFYVFPYKDDYELFFEYIKSYYTEPMNIHADHFNTNYSYGVNAYIKGMIFLKQLEYIVGRQAFNRGLLSYFEKWKFKSPKPKDFIRVIEKHSDLELKWYLDYFVNRSPVIDFGLDTVYLESSTLKVDLARRTIMPMPLDLQINFSDGSVEYYHIPVDLTFGSKKADDFEFRVVDSWKWVDYKYQFRLTDVKKEIISIVIDPSMRLADINREDNTWLMKK